MDGKCSKQSIRRNSTLDAGMRASTTISNAGTIVRQVQTSGAPIDLSLEAQDRQDSYTKKRWQLHG